MDSTNKKIISFSFLLASVLVAFTIHILIKTFSGAFGVVARFASNDFVRHILPVLIGVAIFLALQFNAKVLVWAEEVAIELRKVVWPSRKDTTAMTIVVCIMILISSLIVSVFDFLSGYIINTFLK